MLPLVREATAIAPSLAVVLSPWSAPAWMKSTGSLVGGTLRPEDADAYARYLAKAVQAYTAAGAPVRGLTVQNEPSFSPPGYAGMTLDQGQQRSLLVDQLPAALRAAGVSPHVWAPGRQLRPVARGRCAAVRPGRPRRGDRGGVPLLQR